MRHPIFITAPLVGLMALGACQPSEEAQVNRALQEAALTDDSNLNDIFLTVADPTEAVAYFSRSLAQSPDDITLQRGLATSYTRAQRPTEAVTAWEEVVAHPDTSHEDSVHLAGAFIRANRWSEAETTLDSVPPTHETFERYRLEAVIADGNEEWDRADSFYEIALGLTTSSSSVLNNWGFSKLTRGDFSDAERLFTDALRAEPGLFTAKNNLVLARGAQRNYDLPVISMTQIERAQLLHTLALTAIKQNDLTIGATLLRDAIDTHPRHFEEASRALRALEASQVN